MRRYRNGCYTNSINNVKKIYGRHILQFALLRFCNIVNVGYDEWKSTFVLEMFCQPYSVLPLISGPTSKPIEDYFFFRDIYLAYCCYIKSKSTWFLLQINEHINDIIFHVFSFTVLYLLLYCIHIQYFILTVTVFFCEPDVGVRHVYKYLFTCL
jgi:hypothetical protein